MCESIAAAISFSSRLLCLWRKTNCSDINLNHTIRNCLPRIWNILFSVHPDVNRVKGREMQPVGPQFHVMN